MKKLIVALALALPLMLAGSASKAEASGFKCLFSCCGCCDYCGIPMSPWYTYWPHKAHFQVPAHPEYPFWPAPQTSSLQAPNYGHYNPPPAATYSPVGYYQAAPHYWYGK
ncbi:MAG: hypothetical protein AB7K24_02125 [Gemmataceae bacterium]